MNCCTQKLAYLKLLDSPQVLVNCVLLLLLLLLLLLVASPERTLARCLGRRWWLRMYPVQARWRRTGGSWWCPGPSQCWRCRGACPPQGWRGSSWGTLGRRSGRLVIIFYFFYHHFCKRHVRVSTIYKKNGQASNLLNDKFWTCTLYNLRKTTHITYMVGWLEWVFQKF